MKLALVLFLAIFYVFQVIDGAEVYDTKGVNVDEVLSNERLFNSYVDCVLDKGSCTPEGEELKKDIQEALEDGCAKCTDEQKEGIKKVITLLVKEKKDIWDELVAKFDPDGKYKEKYADLLKDVE